MELLISYIDFLKNVAGSIGPFLLLLGILILIHEWGHFLVARFFGVEVEVFSIGFGPKILKYKKGATTYCLSLFPLGGYVKMFGDNPLTEVPDSEKSKSFLYKKVHEKWLIAFAGPFMNLIFTLMAFFILALVGQNAFLPELGDIEKDSKAYQLGFRSGDLVLSVNDQKISYLEGLNKVIKTHSGKKLSFQILSQDQKQKNISTQPESLKNPNPLELKAFVGSIEGLSFSSKGLRVGLIDSSPAFQAGLKSFDEILSVNDQSLRTWRDLQSFIKKEKASSLHFKVKRGEDIKNISLSHAPSNLNQIGLEPAHLYIERIGPDTPAQKAGLAKGDRIVSINGKKVFRWKDVLQNIQAQEGKTLRISYLRKGEEKSAELSPEMLFVEGNIKKRAMVGIISGGQNVFPESVVRKRAFGEALLYSGQETKRWLGVIAIGLFRLATGDISLRTMGGPVMIGRVAHSSFHQGFSSFLFIMAIISLNLFFLNLLPIPMLDGGHLLFFSLEGILGRPLSVKKLIFAQQVGLILLLSFMGFVIFNDIYNWLKAW